MYQRAQELQDWMSAILHWHNECGRYQEPKLLKRFRPGPRLAKDGPTGLGTHAARAFAGR